MTPAFPEQPATVLLVPDERSPFHALTLSVSRITGPVPADSWANSRFARIMATASCRFVRFLKRGALRVGSWQFLDETDVPLGYLAKDGRELKVHDAMIRLGRRETRRWRTRQSISFARNRHNRSQQPSGV
jgi:hypothetical protein